MRPAERLMRQVLSQAGRRRQMSMGRVREGAGHDASEEESARRLKAARRGPDWQFDTKKR